MATNGYILQIQGMTCGHCAAKVRAALSAQPGVGAVVVDHVTGTARVDGPALAAAGLVTAVQKAGFTVTGFRPQENA